MTEQTDAELVDLVTFADRARNSLDAQQPSPLHRRAHRLKTEGLLSVRQPEPGTFIWQTRTGHTYTNQTDPLPTTGWEEPVAFTPEYLDMLETIPPPDEELAA